MRCEMRQTGQGKPGELTSAPLASGLGQAATETQPFHNEEKRKLARKKPQERGDGVRRDHVGREMPWVARLSVRWDVTAPSTPCPQVGLTDHRRQAPKAEV